MAVENNRWEKQMNRFERAFNLLEKSVHKNGQQPLNKLEEHGLIHQFAFTHELACNFLKDYSAYQGNTTISGSRDAVREAFNKGIIVDGDGWMDMIKSRNLSAHTYNEAIADTITNKIMNVYFKLFADLRAKMNSLM